MSRIAVIRCDGCGRTASRTFCEDVIDRFELHKWERLTVIPCQGSRDYCPRCLDAIRGVTRRKERSLTITESDRPQHGRPGFTLVELLVVIAVVSIIVAGAAASAVSWTADGKVKMGAAIVKTALDAARSLAVKDGAAGVRFVPDPAWGISRLRDGRVHPDTPLAYGRIEPLTQPPPYTSGLVSVHVDGFPDGFTPAYRRLVVEQSPVDSEGRRCEPTSWFWNVRAGALLTLQGKEYVVAGPLGVPFGKDNPDGFVNWGLPGSVSPLDRGAGPVEWLYVTNRVDDDGDGFTDDGWNGYDDDLDGLVDENDEWEVEKFLGQTAFGVTAAEYSLARRPVVASLARSTRLPASIVIDATGWSAMGFNADTYMDRRVRSQLEVDHLTGAAEIMFEASGQAWTPTIYGRAAARPMGRSYAHLWIADRGDVLAPKVRHDSKGMVVYTFPPTSSGAAIVSLDLWTGRTAAGAADAGDPGGTFRVMEGGSQ